SPAFRRKFVARVARQTNLRLKAGLRTGGSSRHYPPLLDDAEKHRVEAVSVVRPSPTPDEAIAKICDYRSIDTGFFRSLLASPRRSVVAGKHIEKSIANPLPG